MISPLAWGEAEADGPVELDTHPSRMRCDLPRALGTRAGNNPGLGADRRKSVFDREAKLTIKTTATVPPPPPVILMPLRQTAVPLIPSTEVPYFHPSGWMTSPTMSVFVLSRSQ